MNENKESNSIHKKRINNRQSKNLKDRNNDYNSTDYDNFHLEGWYGEGVYKEWVGKDANRSLQGDEGSGEGWETKEEEGKEDWRWRREKEEGTNSIQPVCKGYDGSSEGGESRDVSSGFDEGGR